MKKTLYTGSENPIIVTCKKHGDVNIKRANDFLKGRSGCVLCSQINKIKHIKPNIIILGRKKKTQEEWIQEAKEKYKNENYDYSKVKYTGSQCKVDIICSKHGIFSKREDMFLFGQGCPKCANNIPTQEEWKEKAQKIHGNKYSYDKSIYIGSEEKVEIFCNTCKIYFRQLANTHTSQKSGCPFCWNKECSSKKELEILNYIKSIYNGVIEHSNRNILNDNKELDIYIPDKKLAIEFDGLYWHSEKKKSKYYHLQKTLECETKGIQLIHIFEDEWRDKQDIIKSKLKQLLGIKDKKRCGRASQLDIVVLSVDEEKKFFDNNHLQGYIPSTVCYGLCYNNGKRNIFAAMSFGSLRNNLGTKQEQKSYEMYKFAVVKNYNIYGAASKLFKHFINRFNPVKIISFADRRWSIGNMYNKIGFKLDSISEPSFSLVVGNKRINRYTLRKDVLVSKYGCPKELTADEFYNKNQWLKIYDCGTLKYIWNYKS